MVFFRVITCALFALFLAVPFWGAAAAIEPPAVAETTAPGLVTGQEGAEEGTPDEEAWSSLFQNRVQILDTVAQANTDAFGALPAQASALRDELRDIAAELQKLSDLARISHNMPMELGIVLDRIQRLDERLAQATAPLDRLQSSTRTSIDEISQLAGQRHIPVPDRAPDDQAHAYAGRADALLESLQRLQSRLAIILAPARSLGNEIETSRREISEKLPALWRAYYLSSSQKMLDPEGWPEILDGLSTFRETFALRLNAQFPQTLREAAHVAARLVLTLIFLAGLTWFGHRSMVSLRPGMRDGLARMGSHSLPMLYLGIAFYVAAFTPHGDPYLVLIVVATWLFSTGQMLFAWDMRAFSEPALPRRSPLATIFVPMLGGLMLLFFNLPPELLGAIWILLLLGCLWYRHRHPFHDLKFTLERYLITGHSLVLWLALGMTLFGWARLSILVCMAYALIGVCLQLLVAFVKLSNDISSHMTQEGLKGLLMGMALALAVPVLLVLFTLSTGLWVLAYPGGSYLLGRLALLDINLGPRSLTVVQILLVLSAFYITRSAIGVGRLFLRQLPEQGILEKTLISPFQAAFTYLMWFFFGLYALYALGFSLTSISLVAGGLSVGVGLGLQSIVSNFVSGLVLIFGRNIREGDIIEVDGGTNGNVTGTVREIAIRSTTVETFENSTIFVPNSTLLTNNLINWTRNGRSVRRSIDIGVAYGSDIKLALSLLLQVAQDSQKILAFPQPVALFREFGDSTLMLSLRVWIDISDEPEELSGLRMQINDIFAANGISIPFPQLDVHFPENSPENPAQNGQTPPTAASHVSDKV